jgi:heme oxygenase
MEEEGDRHQSHPKLKPVYFPVELRRTPEIIKDLEYFYGSDWKDEIKPSETTTRYMARLRQLSKEDPMLLVPHQYTRYLGDISGGQILKKIFVKAYNLSGADGVRFYEFENIPNFGDFKQLYRSRLDSLNLDREDADRMVSESLKSYDFHIKLFAEMGELCGIEADSQVEVENVPSVHEPTASQPSGKCPFAKTSQERSSSGMLFVVLGVAVALFAILYSYLLA